MIIIKACKELTNENIKEMICLLKDSDEDTERIKQVLLNNEKNQAYYILLQKNGNENEEEKLGAIVMDWEKNEILNICLLSVHRSKGYGKSVMELIKKEAIKLKKPFLLVGTGNSSIDNISFYQKCGYRFDSIKKDYFDYIQPPVKEFGIELKDMVIFKYTL
ncbi:hypothetical protein BJ944DRAFT_265250 [Cunninghamella echinulata]|nr:hypothetical protein BJ944DRAFT_265250 [Cunninghamella echinulata]